MFPNITVDTILEQAREFQEGLSALQSKMERSVLQSLWAGAPWWLRLIYAFALVIMFARSVKAITQWLGLRQR